MPAAIKVEDLSKAYRLGEIGTGTISRDLERYWARVRGKEDPFLKIGEINDRTTKSESNVVWSLKNINFEIEQGDSVGIIGRNGAGKSTLLKILSRVTSPTTGSFKVKGRIASLLEVGTGFHQELTGRENIYLNGAILGMRKAEIKRKFDDIVNFSGVERYIDTPVKRYSSGMYVRLAFAVAAHLESEILIVDEVLAVGDSEFQKKCLGKMGDVSKAEGRTILFVSHNMSSIRQLCNKSILLKNGNLSSIDKTQTIISEYLTESYLSNCFSKIIDPAMVIQLTEATIINESTLDYSIINVIIHSNISCLCSVDVRIKDSIGAPFGFSSLGALNNAELIDFKPGKNELSLAIYTANFAIGSYQLSIDITNPGILYYDCNDDILQMEIIAHNENIYKKNLMQDWNLGSYHVPMKLLQHV